VGRRALHENQAGHWNTAIGRSALHDNISANSNTALGRSALFKNTDANNTAVGDQALLNKVTGSGNIAIGFAAGRNFLGGDNNIFIGNEGPQADQGLILIGTPLTHTQTYIAGIQAAVGTFSTAVCINSSNRLGPCGPSSIRFKEEIADLGRTSGGILALRPVTFRFKQEVTEGVRPLEFGLIAEEVAELFPDLVTYDGEGRPLTVRYHVLPVLLLNELQRQERSIELLTKRIMELEKQR
jgi:hypothetical protein